MSDTDLSRAVEAFAARVIDIPDAAMERDWPWRSKDTDIRWGFYRTYEELRDLAATIDAQRAAKGPRQTFAQRALAVYGVAYRDLKALLLGLDEGDLDRAPAEGEWPLRTVFEHLMRAERRFLAETVFAVGRHRRGEPVQPMPEELFPPYVGDGDALRTLLQIVAGYDALHQQALDKLSGLSDEDVAAPMIWWYEADVRFQLFRFDAHLREHTIQAEKVLEAIRPRPSDTLRTLRLTYRALGSVEGALLGASSTLADRTSETAAAIAVRTQELLNAADRD